MASAAIGGDQANEDGKSISSKRSKVAKSTVPDSINKGGTLNE